MRFGLAMSSREQTGQSEAIHSPDEWHSRVVTLTISRLVIDRGRLHSSDLVFA